MTSIAVPFLLRMIRRKDATQDVLSTNLRRCLSTLDVAFFGIGNMLGSAVYVLTPSTSKLMTGPAIVISYFLAGVASCFAALAYAEFGVRYPRAGSAYSYTYYSLGEILSFFVGWNLIMENILSLSAVARTCPSFIDALFGGAIQKFTLSIIGSIHVEYLAEYPDVFSACILAIFLVFMMLGAKETSWLNNALVVVNVTVVSVICGVGMYFADFSNWKYDPARGDPKPEGFVSGFLPFGWAGVFRACASCFFAYVGFDGIAAAGEEAKNPRKSIPIATGITMTVVSVAYVGVSALLTLMMPYYTINENSGIPDAMASKGAYWAQYVVSIGAVFSMMAVIIGTIYSVSRVAYAMAEDGLLPAFMCKTFRQVPFISMSLFVFLASLISIFVNVNVIIEMLSIGTLFAYMLVAYAIVVNRHDPQLKLDEEKTSDQPFQLKEWAESRGLRSLYILGDLSHKTVVLIIMSLILILAFIIGFTLNSPSLDSTARYSILGTALTFYLVLSLALIPLKELLHEDSYKMPLVPILPVVSILMNAFLMTTLESVTWYRFIIWMGLGFLMYFFHGMRHSKLNQD